MSGLNAALANQQQLLQQQQQLSQRGEAPDKSPAASPRDDEDDSGSERGGGGDEGDDAPIQVYCRIRPSRGAAASKSVLVLDPHEKKVEFNLGKETGTANTINNTREQFKFHFTGVFDEHTTQTNIFDNIGRRVIDNVTEGYNGTIFAYGQTGSGKTYTMMGGTDKYEDRGLIPRTLTYLFDWIAEHSSEFSVTLRISYLEIYNDKGYDLLDPAHEHKSLEQLPRVILLEGERGQVHFKNLGELPAANIDEALNLLFVGDTNRVVCETPSNDASTRSHCIFMINLEVRTTEGKVRRSKLNLVDLAGSERVKKTGVGGKILNEALHINVSLHYLEQVIVALHDVGKGKGDFVPYRNSTLTSVLRDSLGGNCRTVMIATLSNERHHLDESISTSRFATRVAQIRNKALLNEELDPYVLVKQLKAKLREARDELAVVRGDKGANFRPLDEEELRSCAQLVRAFLKDNRDKQLFDEDKTGSFQAIPMANPYKVRACFDAFKGHVLATGKNPALNFADATATQGKDANGTAVATSPAAAAEIVRLRSENAALVDALRRHAGPDAAEAALRSAGGGQSTAGRRTDHAREPSQQQSQPQQGAPSSRDPAAAAAPSRSFAAAAPSGPPQAPAPTAAELALARVRAEAFESFRRSYRKHALVEEQKATHAAKVDEARRTGESINQIRGEINKTKSQIEAHRLARGVATLAEGSSDAAVDPLPPDSTELALHSRIDQLKASYRSQFQSLKNLKSEIDFLKNVVEKARLQLQADFEKWWAMQPQSQSQSQQQGQQQREEDRPASSSSREEPSAPRLISSAVSVASSASFPSFSSSSSSASRSSRPPPAVATEAWGSGPADPARALAAAASSASRAAAAAPPSRQQQQQEHLMPGGLRTTGISSADADIARFYELKQEMMRQRQQQQQ